MNKRGCMCAYVPSMSGANVWVCVCCGAIPIYYYLNDCYCYYNFILFNIHGRHTRTTLHR